MTCPACKSPEPMSALYIGTAHGLTCPTCNATWICLPAGDGGDNEWGRFMPCHKESTFLRRLESRPVPA